MQILGEKQSCWKLAKVCSAHGDIHSGQNCMPLSRMRRGNIFLAYVWLYMNDICWRVPDSAGFKTFKNPVLTINDHKVGSFSDISLEHKIFSLDRIFVHHSYMQSKPSSARQTYQSICTCFEWIFYTKIVLILFVFFHT